MGDNGRMHAQVRIQRARPRGLRELLVELHCVLVGVPDPDGLVVAGGAERGVRRAGRQPPDLKWADFGHNKAPKVRNIGTQRQSVRTLARQSVRRSGQ